MSANVKKLKDYATTLEEMRKMYKESSKLGSPVKKHVRRVTTPSSPWKAMSTAGAAILLSPEPFTDIVGIPLFLVGTGMSKYRPPAKLSDVYKHQQMVAKTLKELKDSLHL